MGASAIIIGSGLSGLAAASLLAKRGISVTVIEHAFKPGGSCGVFKREGAIFDQGAAMMFGFGKRGFNSHRFIFNCLEEPIDVIRNEALYDVHYKGHKIRFHRDIDKYIDELAKVFPAERENLRRFYSDMKVLYDDVIANEPNFTTPDRTDRKEALKQVLKHPVSYIKFLTYLNRSTESVLRKYFRDEAILAYFNKLTSTYCYTDISETPAVFAAVMFVDNHAGGSFYPKGSTIFVPGKLEKSIEEHGGVMLYEKTVERIIVENNRAKGVILDDGTKIFADAVIYSGTVWNLYEKLLMDAPVPASRRKWAAGLKASYPSVLLYSIVKKDAIPEGTGPITLFSTDAEQLDDSEVTVYIFSIADPSICPPDCHVVTAIGPTYKKWPAIADRYQTLAEYRKLKAEEEERLLTLLDGKFPGFRSKVVHKEVSTPLSIERYTMKNRGSVAGPLQSMGQHMFRRLHINSEFAGLYYCGESTIMGTGTPTVTVSGISAANAMLKDLGMEEFKYREGMTDFVREHAPGKISDQESDGSDEAVKLAKLAARCEYCERPACMAGIGLDIRGVNRRLTVGNVCGASKIAKTSPEDEAALEAAERRCVLNKRGGSVAIRKIISQLREANSQDCMRK